MKRKYYYNGLCAIALLLCMSCHNDKQQVEEEQKVGTSTMIEGDSTLYGLACDGCSDSVLVFLPGKGGNPVTYDILEATKRHKVIGRPKVGDWVAVLLNGKDTTVADMVIDLDQLKGTWVKQVMPTVGEQAEKIPVAADQEEKDSIIQTMMKPIEMGFSLKRHYTAQTVGRRQRRQRQDNDSPIRYPIVKNYTKWHVFNGSLILTSEERSRNDSVAGPITNDTVEFVFLTRDSLRLRFKDGEKGFYRKK